jgi:hypothetical protein
VADWKPVDYSNVHKWALWIMENVDDCKDVGSLREAVRGS